jgi:hypothetical protein
MSDAEPTIKRRIFVAALAKAVSPMDSAGAVNAMLAFLPSLAHVPESVFDDPQRLATELAREWDRVPTLGRLTKALEARAPRGGPSYPELEAAPMAAEERANAAVWLRHREANDLPERDMRARLAVIRRFAPAAYAWLTNNDLLAADIAVRAGWTEQQPGRDWEDAETVRERVAGHADDPAALALLRGLVAKWAPENLDLIPESAPIGAEIDAAGSGTIARPVPREQLLQAYEALPGGNARVAMLRREIAEATRPPAWEPADADDQLEQGGGGGS